VDTIEQPQPDTATEVSAPPQPAIDLEGFVDDVLADEELKESAWAVGLRRADVIALAKRLRKKLSEVPLDLSGALAQRERQLDNLDAFATQRRRLAKLLGWLTVAALTLIIVAGVVVGGTLIGWTTSVVAGATAIVAAAAWLLPFAKGYVDGMKDGAEAARGNGRAAVEAAHRDIHNYRVSELRKALRVEVNARDDEQYRTTMKEVEGRGLAEIENPRNLIPTDGRGRLERLLREMPAGSIGLSGPRGAGKSSLIGATCPSGDDQPEGMLGIVVSAPVQFNAREFVLHLFAELCRAILGRAEVERLRTPVPFLNLGNLRPLLLLQVIAPLVLLAGAGMLLVNVAGVNENLVWAVVVLAAGVALCVAVWQVSARDSRARASYGDGFRTYESEERRRRFGSETFDLASYRLTDIWFQQSFTSEWSGSINLPVGLQGGLEGGRELARQQMSMPDVVRELRHLVMTLTTEGGSAPGGMSWGYEGQVTEVRIGIDELDKIDSPEDACNFLNEIKVLFGIPRCFFLVSLSEDAMSQFERRGLPLRDVFDSSFDEVIRVAPLAASKSVALLRERTIGMPIPFMLLCHCMAGGLPRDVIRMAREILPGDAEKHRLSETCGALIASQLASKVEATLIASRRLPRSPEVEGFQGWLQALRVRPATSQRLIETCRDPEPSLAAARAFWPELQRSGATNTDLPREVIAFCYFCATVVDFFRDDRRPAEYRDATWGNGGLAVADELAAAHQAFAVNPGAAWEATTAVRKRIGSELIDSPL
jgi:hypothetical protein